LQLCWHDRLASCSLVDVFIELIENDRYRPQAAVRLFQQATSVVIHLADIPRLRVWLFTELIDFYCDVNQFLVDAELSFEVIRLCVIHHSQREDACVLALSRVASLT